MANAASSIKPTSVNRSSTSSATSSGISRSASRSANSARVRGCPVNLSSRIVRATECGSAIPSNAGSASPSGPSPARFFPRRDAPPPNSRRRTTARRLRPNPTRAPASAPPRTSGTASTPLPAQARRADGSAGWSCPRHGGQVQREPVADVVGAVSRARRRAPPLSDGLAERRTTQGRARRRRLVGREGFRCGQGIVGPRSTPASTAPRPDSDWSSGSAISVSPQGSTVAGVCLLPPVRRPALPDPTARRAPRRQLLPGIPGRWLLPACHQYGGEPDSGRARSSGASSSAQGIRRSPGSLVSTRRARRSDTFSRDVGTSDPADGTVGRAEVRQIVGHGLVSVRLWIGSGACAAGTRSPTRVLDGVRRAAGDLRPRPGVLGPGPGGLRGVGTVPRGQRRRQMWAEERCRPQRIDQKSTSTSAVAASSAGWSTVAPMPIFSLIFFSSSLARSGLSRRKFRAFSRPWPSWSLS